MSIKKPSVTEVLRGHDEKAYAFLTASVSKTHLLSAKCPCGWYGTRKIELTTSLDRMACPSCQRVKTLRRNN